MNIGSARNDRKQHFYLSKATTLRSLLPIKVAKKAALYISVCPSRHKNADHMRKTGLQS